MNPSDSFIDFLDQYGNQYPPEMVYQNAYEKLDVADRFEFVQHPDGHLLRWDLAEGFLKKHL